MKLFSNSQYGFRSGHSTEYAAIDLVDNIITQMDNNEIPISIFLDLSKAFDTIDHAILLHKLQHYGIDGIHLQLFKSYLSNRKQYVEIDDIKSNTLPITTEWLEINKLSLNVAKCKYMIFHMHNKQINVPAPTINSMPIQKVDEFNFLGLTLDTHLNWKKH